MLNKISPENLPDFGEPVELYFLDEHVNFAVRERSERIPDQWTWATAEGWLPSDAPFIVGWKREDPRRQFRRKNNVLYAIEHTPPTSDELKPPYQQIQKWLDSCNISLLECHHATLEELIRVANSAYSLGYLATAGHDLNHAQLRALLNYRGPGLSDLNSCASIRFTAFIKLAYQSGKERLAQN